VIPYLSDKQNFGVEFVKQQLSLKDSSAAWRAAVDKYKTGMGPEFDARITGTKADHENKVVKARLRRKKYDKEISNNVKSLPPTDDIATLHHL